MEYVSLFFINGFDVIIRLYFELKNVGEETFFDFFTKSAEFAIPPRILCYSLEVRQNLPSRRMVKGEG